MKRVGEARDFDGQLTYHAQASYAADFTVEHPQRIALAKRYINTVLFQENGRPLTIVELGCGSGDISGPYAADNEVVGVDVAQPAIIACQQRWPKMVSFWSPVEALSPMTCDVLVMTEFLEHVVDPEKIVRAWMPLAKYAILGHPLNEPDPPLEPGHIWSYDRTDWAQWFAIGRHELVHDETYPLGNWPEAIVGWSQRVGG